MKGEVELNTKSKIRTWFSNPSFLFWLLLLFQILIIIHYGTRKLNLFGDEIWTFNLANRYFEPFIGDASRYYNQWLDWNFWNATLTVLPEHRFSFDSVFYNQAHDVHPPLYYILIHTVCSLFPEQFSKWFGIIPNIAFFVITQLVIWFTAKKLFFSKWSALLVTAFYGFSWGTINNAVYVRMYAMLTVWAILSYVLHLKMIRSFTYKHYVAILGISFLGIMTQYYFLIYEFFLSLGFCFILIMQKKYKDLFLYAAGFMILAGIIIWFYPPIIDQLLGRVGNQGQAAMQNMMGSNFTQRVGVFGHIISKDLFGAHIIWVFSILIIMFFVKLFSFFGQLSIRRDIDNSRVKISFSLHSAEIETSIKVDHLKICLLYSLFCCLGYFCIIAKIAPYLESRYLVIIHPIIIILFTYILGKFRELYRIPKKYFIVGFFIMLALFSTKMYRADNLFSYDKNYSNINRVIAQQHSDIAFIIVTKGKSWWPTINEALTLRKVKASYMIQEDEMDSLPNILENYRQTHSKFLVYRGVYCKTKEAEFVKKLKSQFLGASVKKIDSFMGEVYLVDRNLT
jgi:uncharacterized membrane protein